ncbi:MAG: acyl carrier protein [Gammaproteobacteria bacterium]|nr:acyl carrier protein [Gammaproteobacteria bacterium]MDH3465208.1 acyl carrier protein [Gammaproteobacteria bacterium]
MTEQEIRDQLSEILVQQFEIQAGDVQPQAHLYDDLGIDSIDAVDLIVRLKEITGLRIPPEDFKNVRTVEDVVQVVNSLAVDT